MKVNRIRNLEEEIQLINKKLPPLREFILPGGNEISARIHHARAVCRRAERSLVMMMETKKYKDIWIKYLNRLSDYLFVLARLMGIDKDSPEDTWKRT